MKRKYGMIVLMALMLLVFGCQNSVSENDKVPSDAAEAEAAPEVTTAEKPVESAADSTKEDATEAPLEVVSPYQYLALMAGNSTYLSFDYKVVFSETGLETEGNFARTDDFASTNYTDWDMDGEPVAIVEIERDGRHYFVLHEKKAIFGFVGPSAHMIYYEMLAAVQEAPVREELVEGGKVFEYHMPFIHDDQIKLRYVFKMTPEGLESLDYFVDETLSRTVTFGPFLTDELPMSFYELPQNYEITEYDYTFDEGHMPPWWDYDHSN